MDIEYGVAVPVAETVRRITCNNPSPLTGPGTNSYLLGDAIIIDPGPEDPAHLSALLAAAPDVQAILVTHSHLDHSPGARALSRATGAPVYGFGPSGAGTSPVMAALPDLGGGEGTDHQFAPDHLLADGEVLDLGGIQVAAHHTPGHFGNHMTFEMDGICFSGDLVMGWATTLISPPDGDLTDFMASCIALLTRAPHLLLPGHGAPVTDPAGRIEWLLAHRRARETQILGALVEGPATPTALTSRIYSEVPPHLLPAAERNVLAHLIDLTGRNKVQPMGALSPISQFRLT